MAAPILLGRVQSGSTALADGKGVNDTYVGLVDVEGLGPLRAYIKDLPAKQLANELLAASLAESVGLPVPRPILAVAAAQDLQAKHGPTIAGERLVFASSDEGAQSASLMIKGGHLDGRKLRDFLLAWSKLAEAVAFDAWIANGDRHTGNLLIRNGEICLVDHSHAFTGPSWNAASLSSSPQVQNKLAIILREALSTDETFPSFIGRVGNCQVSFSKVDLGREFLAAHLNSIVVDEDLGALRIYIAARCATLGQYIAAALGRPRLS